MLIEDTPQSYTEHMMDRIFIKAINNHTDPSKINFKDENKARARVDKKLAYNGKVISREQFINLCLLYFDNNYSNYKNYKLQFKRCVEDYAFNKIIKENYFPY